MNEKDLENVKKRKCLHHPAMECPSPSEPCIFTRTRNAPKGKKID
jgi:hypothetical protein